MKIHFPDQVYKLRGSFGKKLMKDIDYFLMMTETLGYKKSVEHSGDDEKGWFKYIMKGTDKSFDIVCFHQKRKIYKIASVYHKDGRSTFCETLVGFGVESHVNPIDQIMSKL